MGTTPRWKLRQRASGQAWPGRASARRRSGLGPDRGVQPPGHCSVRHFFFLIYFIFKLYIIVLVLPNIKMNPSQVYMCSPS